LSLIGDEKEKNSSYLYRQRYLAKGGYCWEWFCKDFSVKFKTFIEKSKAFKDKS
jgi:hypothetical protein